MDNLVAAIEAFLAGKATLSDVWAGWESCSPGRTPFGASPEEVLDAKVFANLHFFADGDITEAELKETLADAVNNFRSAIAA